MGGRTIQTVEIMPVVVQKYGGTSVADPSRIETVADRVRGLRDQGIDCVVVVSAMGQTTDELVSLAARISDRPDPREMDMLLSAGERVSMSLLAMALQARGVPAVSYTGSQAGILTDSSHGEARITEITGERVKNSLAKGLVVVVAGFQGVDPVSREITTLGRGGSDTSAVALAAALDAKACEILTDVSGVFTADPRAVPSARKLSFLGFEDMLGLAEAGAAVLKPHSVEYARDAGVAVHVRSSFSQEDGTWVTPDAPHRKIVGIAAETVNDEGRITIVGPEASASLPRILNVLNVEGIDGRRGESGEQMARVRVHIERIPETLRSIHRELFEKGEAG